MDPVQWSPDRLCQTVDVEVARLRSTGDPASRGTLLALPEHDTRVPQPRRSSGAIGGRPASMTADKLARARAMLAAGKSKSATARAIGVSRPTLYAHLASGT